MTYSSRSDGGLLPGRLVAFIPAALAAFALGTGGCSIDFSAACARGRTCDGGPTARKGAAGEIAFSGTGGAGGFANSGLPVSGGIGVLVDTGTAAGGSPTTRADS